MTDNADRHDSEFIRISAIDNTFEAQLVTSILEERGIAHRLVSHHDTAYDGLYQLQKGWGEILAPASYGDKILEIISEVRAQAPDIKDR
ncbi:MAG: hypothetical protein ACQERN_14610 [Thermodesulfobacteriota bacterium]